MRNLKYAISNIAWDKNDDEFMYDYLKQHRFTGIEIAPTRIIEDSPYEKSQEAAQFKEEMNKYGLIVCSMQSIWFGRQENIFKSAEDRQALVEYTKKTIDFAQTIGCKNLVFGCPKNRNIETPSENDHNIALEFFKEIGSYASEKDVFISIEPNPSIYNTNFLNTTSEALEFIKELGMDFIKLNCDLGTMIYNDEDVDLIISNIELVNHIHISEPNLVPPTFRDMHKVLFDKLENIGYDKYISIEMKMQNLEKVKEIITYVENI